MLVTKTFKGAKRKDPALKRNATSSTLIDVQIPLLKVMANSLLAMPEIQALKPALDNFFLRYHIREMVKQGKVNRQGSSKSTKYCVNPKWIIRLN
jgi:hypothetical protein